MYCGRQLLPESKYLSCCEYTTTWRLFVFHETCHKIMENENSGYMSGWIRSITQASQAIVKKTDSAVKLFTGEDNYHFLDITRVAASWVTGDKRPYPRVSHSNNGSPDPAHQALRVQDIDNVRLWSISIPSARMPMKINDDTNTYARTSFERGSTVTGRIHLDVDTFAFICKIAPPNNDHTVNSPSFSDGSEDTKGNTVACVDTSTPEVLQQSPTPSPSTAVGNLADAMNEDADTVQGTEECEDGKSDINVDHSVVSNPENIVEASGVQDTLSNETLKSASRQIDTKKVPSEHDDIDSGRDSIDEENISKSDCGGTEELDGIANGMEHHQGESPDSPSPGEHTLFELSYALIRDIDMPVHFKTSHPVQMRIVLKTFQIITLTVSLGESALAIFQALAMRAFPGRREALPAFNCATDDSTTETLLYKNTPEVEPTRVESVYVDALSESPSSDLFQSTEEDIPSNNTSPVTPTRISTATISPVTAPVAINDDCAKHDGTTGTVSPMPISNINQYPSTANAGMVLSSDIPSTTMLSSEVFSDPDCASEQTIEKSVPPSSTTPTTITAPATSNSIAMNIDEQRSRWEDLDICAEYTRMGVSKNWRQTDVNSDYSVCDTYPQVLYVPACISDTHVRLAAQHRSQGRFPILSYYAAPHRAVILRSAQPLSGPMSRRSQYNEQLLMAAFQADYEHTKEKCYHICDARPMINAMANKAGGKGYETWSNYGRLCQGSFLDIGNIHTMRASLEQVLEAASTPSVILPWVRIIDDLLQDDRDTAEPAIEAAFRSKYVNWLANSI